MAFVTPFPSFEGTPSVAMADVNGDMILDLIVGTGEGVEPEVVAYSGDDTPLGRFESELTRFAPFEADFRGGVRVARADIDGNALADNIIVGSGPGIESQVKVFASTIPGDPGKAPDLFASFVPYPGSKSGVTVATGMVELGSGRESIVTAPGPGDAPRIKTFHYDLFTPTAQMRARETQHEHDGYPGAPTQTSEFLAFDESYTDGVSLSTGWVAGEEGGAKSIVTGQLAGDGTVRTWSSGSRLDGFPGMYLQSPNHHKGRRRIHPDLIVRTIRRRGAGSGGGDNQHHGRCGFVGQRRGCRRVRGSQVRSRQARAGGDDAGTEAAGHDATGCRLERPGATGWSLNLRAGARKPGSLGRKRPSTAP